jgi:hypothetical protein
VSSTLTPSADPTGADGELLSRRGLLAAGGGLLGAAALGGAGLATAPVAEAATGDPVLHLLRRTT